MARSFNGSSDYLRYSGAVVTATPLTIAGWFDENNPGFIRTLVYIGQSSSTSNRNHWSLRVGDGSIQAVAATSSAATASVSGTYTGWSHGAAVFGSDTSRYAYGNGVAGTENTTAKTPASVNRTSIGNLDDSSGYSTNWYTGDAAEIGIWNVALDAAEIAALAAGVCPLLVRPTSLVSYWPIIGQYSPEIDMKGGYGLTVTGTSTANHPRIYRASGPLQLGVPYVAPSGYFNRYYYEQFIARGSW